MEVKHGNTASSPAVDVTIGGEAYPQPWRIVQVRSKCERRIAQQISDLGYETYVPTQIEFHQWSDRKKRVERILIPLIVFARLDDASASQIERLPSVFGLMRAPGCRQPAVVPDEQIDQLRFMVGNSDSPVEISPEPMTPGDRVEVIRGKLRGLTGQVLTTPDGHSRLSISIDLLGCATVEIDLQSVRLCKKEKS